MIARSRLFAIEELELRFANGALGTFCVKCHGQSIEHRNDEDNITPPDTIFPGRRINASCEKCHEGHDVAPAKVGASCRN